MFSNCNSLLSLPDISKRNTDNVIDMSYMFSRPYSIIIINIAIIITPIAIIITPSTLIITPLH